MEGLPPLHPTPAWEKFPCFVHNTMSEPHPSSYCRLPCDKPNHTGILTCIADVRYTVHWNVHEQMWKSFAIDWMFDRIAEYWIRYRNCPHVIIRELPLRDGCRKLWGRGVTLNQSNFEKKTFFRDDIGPFYVGHPKHFLHLVPSPLQLFLMHCNVLVPVPRWYQILGKCKLI